MQRLFSLFIKLGLGLALFVLVSSGVTLAQSGDAPPRTSLDQSFWRSRAGLLTPRDITKFPELKNDQPCNAGADPAVRTTTWGKYLEIENLATDDAGGSLRYSLGQAPGDLTAPRSGYLISNALSTSQPATWQNLQLYYGGIARNNIKLFYRVSDKQGTRDPKARDWLPLTIKQEGSRLTCSNNERRQLNLPINKSGLYFQYKIQIEPRAANQIVVYRINLNYQSANTVPSPKTSPSLSPRPSPSPSATPSPLASPSPSPRLSPNPSPSPSVAVTPSPSPSPSVAPYTLLFITDKDSQGIANALRKKMKNEWEPYKRLGNQFAIKIIQSPRFQCDKVSCSGYSYVNGKLVQDPSFYKVLGEVLSQQKAHAAVILSETLERSGADARSVVVLSTSDDNYERVLFHELGHTVGHFMDEYSYHNDPRDYVRKYWETACGKIKYSLAPNMVTFRSSTFPDEAKAREFLNGDNMFKRALVPWYSKIKPAPETLLTSPADSGRVLGSPNSSRSAFGLHIGGMCTGWVPSYRVFGFPTYMTSQNIDTNPSYYQEVIIKNMGLARGVPIIPKKK